MLAGYTVKMPTPWKPTREQLLAAKDKTIPDLIAPNLKVLFVGINPGLWSAATGHHFARPGNRFWPALFAAGFTPRIISPFDEKELLTFGYGITNIVPRGTAAADELSREEFVAGGKRLLKNVKKYKPKIVAVLGVGAYRHALDRPKAIIGKQPEKLGDSLLWVLPNPSGLNANYQAADLKKLFSDLRNAADREEF